MKPEIMKYISVRERKRFMKCPDCGNHFDMRNLQDVFDHFHKSAGIEAEYSHSKRVGEPTVYSNIERPNSIR